MDPLLLYIFLKYQHQCGMTNICRHKCSQIIGFKGFLELAFLFILLLCKIDITNLNILHQYVYDLHNLSFSTGPQTRIVPSSEALASMLGCLGFQWTQFTVLVWPSNTAIGVSLFICHMYNLWSVKNKPIWNLSYITGIMLNEILLTWPCWFTIHQ